MTTARYVSKILEINLDILQVPDGEVVTRIFGIWESEAPQRFKILRARVYRAKQYFNPLQMLLHECRNDGQDVIIRYIENKIFM